MSEPADGSPSIKPEIEFTPLPDGAPWWAKWLRQNWQSIWREWSSWLAGAAGALAVLSEALPVWAPTLSLYVSDNVMHTLTAVCAFAALGAKFVKQRRAP